MKAHALVGKCDHRVVCRAYLRVADTERRRAGRQTLAGPRLGGSRDHVRGALHRKDKSQHAADHKQKLEEVQIQGLQSSVLQQQWAEI